MQRFSLDSLPSGSLMALSPTGLICIVAPLAAIGQFSYMTAATNISWPPPERRIVMMLLGPCKCAPLSPFFSLARCVGVADFQGKCYRLLDSPETRAEEVTSRLISYEPRVLIAGFVPDAACERLAAAGIDVRIGHCSVPALTLARHYQRLPRASEAANAASKCRTVLHHN